MTSKISYSKFIKEDIRHRGWLAALSCVFLLLSVTVSTMLLLETSLSSELSFDNPNRAEQLMVIRNTFPAMLNGSYNMFPLLLILLLGVLAAVTGFSYLHSKEKTDFYHSLPLSRQQLFAISYLSGLLIFAVPYLAAGLLTILAGSVYGIVTASVLGKSLLAMLGGILGFLLLYHLTLFAMMLTGKIVTGILAAATLFVYGSIAGALARNLASYFFSTYHAQNAWLSDMLYGFRSPLEILGQILGGTTYFDNQYHSANAMTYYTLRFFNVSDTRSLAAILAVTVTVLAATLFLSVLVYKKRPSEAAGNALAFPWTAPFIKVMISVPTALFLGLLIGSMYGSGAKWVILISILMVILLCALIEFIYHMDLRQLFSGKVSSILSFLAVAGILCILHFDVFGYDTWLPEESSLESMALDISQIYSYFCYPNTVAYNVNQPLNPNLLEDEDSQLQDFSAIYELAQEGVENQRANFNETGNQDAEEAVSISIRYNKKSGKSVYRIYTVRKEHALTALSALCQDESYRKKLFPIFYVDYDSVSAVRLTDVYQRPELLELTRAQQDALLDAYKQDVIKADIRDLQYEMPAGELSLDIPETMQPGISVYSSKYNITLPNFYLYESYENSLALLEKYGYTIRQRIDPEDVAQVTLSEADFSKTVDAYESAVWTAESQESILTEPDEIEHILSQIQYTVLPILGREKPFLRSVEILLKDGPDPTYYALP